MKYKCKIVACLCAIVMALVILIFALQNDNNDTINAIHEKSASDTDISTIVYNGQEYYELYELSASRKDFNIPSDIYEFGDYIQFSSDRVDLEHFLDLLPPLESKNYSLPRNKFFVYKNDRKDHPTVIFKRDYGAGGPSDGWYYFIEGFDFQMPEIGKNTVSEIVLTDDIGNAVYSINNTDQVEPILSAILKREDIFPILQDCTEKQWVYLYVYYADFPFAQGIGWSDGQIFKYREAEENQGTVL